ncbi:unnamed protein product [Phytophthora fragariaefolia]|uniref:Unnamed protein product n=1 Tax=Phytophthora fragariaefolia TaxID=1490495 RepID=A0A9W6XX09_9STRA|nr:unnamed protein product [Phytophthora fragariaefolia]
MTSNSTMFASSTMGPGPPSSLSGSTVVMRGAGSFADSEVNPTDYYNSGAPLAPSATSEDSAELLTPRTERKKDVPLRSARRSQRKRSLSHRNSKGSASADGPPTTLMRKHSGRMVSKARHTGDKNLQPPIKEIMTGEYILFTEENVPVSLPHRQQHQQIVPRRRSRSQPKSVQMGTRPQYKEEPGVSFQFYERGGNGRAPAPPAPLPTASSRSISMSSSCSTNDSFMMGSSSMSSMRASQYSDRVSLETNFGSFNPPTAMGNTGRLIESGYAPSIQEDDEAQVLEQLNGWLHASSVSTQDSFMLSR